MLFVRLFDLRLFGFSVSSSSWCLGGAAFCDCGILWTFLLPFFLRIIEVHEVCLVSYVCRDRAIKFLYFRDVLILR